MSDKHTHFGFEQLPVGEKAGRVREVFDSVAGNYDLMNDLMSFGIHRLWKKIAIDMLAIRPGQTVLDLAGGTGDLAAAISTKVGADGQVLLCDINAAMLTEGRKRLLDDGKAANVRTVQANAEALPFRPRSLDAVSMAFGLRNVTDKPQALRSIYSTLRPGGRLLVLEFSKPSSAALSKVYDLYSFKILPRIGEWVAKDADSYQYLAESIRMHPDQETLQAMMQSAGFEDCSYQNLSGGIVAIHRGYRY